MRNTFAWEHPSRGVVMCLVGAFLLTAAGEATAIRSGSSSLALVTVLWYGGAFCVLAWYRLPLALIGLVFTLPLITVEVGFGDVEKTLSADKVALGAVVGVWVLRRGRAAWSRLIGISPVRWWLAFLVVVLVSAVANAPTLGQAWGVLKQALYAGMFLMALDILETDRLFLRRLVTVTAITGVLVAILALAEGISRRMGSPLPLYFKQSTMMDILVPGGTISHVNFLGGYLLLILPILVAASSACGSGVRRWLISGGVIVALTFPYVGSMGASVGLVVAGLVAAGLTVSGMLPVSFRRLSVCSLVAVILIAVAIIVPKSMSQSISLSTRLVTYRIGFVALTERPLLGYGANGYPQQWSRLERKIFGSERTELHERDIPLSAHSAFVDVGVERGLLGLAAFVGLLISLLRRGLEGFFQSSDLQVRMILAGLIAGLAGFIVQAFTENLFSYSKVAAIFWILAAALVSLARESEARSSR